MPFPAQKVWCICVPLSPREWVSFILGVDGSCICFALGKEPKLEFTPTFLGDGVMSQLLRPKPSVLAAGELLDLLHRATWFSSKWQWSNLCLLFFCCLTCECRPYSSSTHVCPNNSSSDFFHLLPLSWFWASCIRTLWARAKLSQSNPLLSCLSSL